MSEISRNYQEELETLIRQNAARKLTPTLLLHSCCAPCSSYVLDYLAPHFEVTVFYYNPNIMPEAEYRKRLADQVKLCKTLSVPYIEGAYEAQTFLDIAGGLASEPEGGTRCRLCQELRLEKTARAARAGEYSYFGTTLTVSPHKDADCINQLGSALAEKYNLLYLSSDFKKNGGYQKSIALSKQHGLYRQNYCGCKFKK